MNVAAAQASDEALSPRIREVARGDLPGILKLYVDSGLEMGEEISLARAEEIHAQVERTPGYRLYVAEQGGVLVGSFALLIMVNLGHQGSPSGVVEDVAVAPEWQGRGIGRAMMAFAAGQCRARGCYKLVLSSNTRRSGAHDFYERLGFKRHGYSYRLDPS